MNFGVVFIVVIIPIPLSSPVPFHCHILLSLHSPMPRIFSSLITSPFIPPQPSSYRRPPNSSHSNVNECLPTSDIDFDLHDHARGEKDESKTCWTCGNRDISRGSNKTCKYSCFSYCICPEYVPSNCWVNVSCIRSQSITFMGSRGSELWCLRILWNLWSLFYYPDFLSPLITVVYCHPSVSSSCSQYIT
jgi:hypothetical protein